MPNLPGTEVTQLDSRRFEIAIDKDRNLNQIFKILSDSGIQVESMRNKNNRLEELFLNLFNSNE